MPKVKLILDDELWNKIELARIMVNAINRQHNPEIKPLTLSQTVEALLKRGIRNKEGGKINLENLKIDGSRR